MPDIVGGVLPPTKSSLDDVVLPPHALSKKIRIRQAERWVKCNGKERMVDVQCIDITPWSAVIEVYCTEKQRVQFIVLTIV